MSTETEINPADYQLHEGDTGSADFQIALLTKRIKHLTDHMGEHKKDFASRRGLLDDGCSTPQTARLPQGSVRGAATPSSSRASDCAAKLLSCKRSRFLPVAVLLYAGGRLCCLVSHFPLSLRLCL